MEDFFMQNIDMSGLAKAWNSPYVARKQVAKFSGGILHPRTMANLDSLGQGPRGRIRMGRAIAYPTSELVAWMQERTELVEG
jgi:hypothetical protein